MNECKLTCTSGTVTAKIGDRFAGKEGEWEIVQFGEARSYSPSSLGGTPTVVIRPIGHDMPSFYQRYANGDGTVDYCGDSVAALMLTKDDRKPRDARGYPLRTDGETARD